MSGALSAGYWESGQIISGFLASSFPVVYECLLITPCMKDNRSTVKPQQECLHAINFSYWGGWGGGEGGSEERVK